MFIFLTYLGSREFGLCTGIQNGYAVTRCDLKYLAPC